MEFINDTDYIIAFLSDTHGIQNVFPKSGKARRTISLGLEMKGLVREIKSRNTTGQPSVLVFQIEPEKEPKDETRTKMKLQVVHRIPHANGEDFSKKVVKTINV